MKNVIVIVPTAQSHPLRNGPQDHNRSPTARLLARGAEKRASAENAAHGWPSAGLTDGTVDLLCRFIGTRTIVIFKYDI